MRAAIVEVLSQVFAVPAPSIDDGFGPKTCKKWDSLKHLQMVMALEDRFAITFDPAEVPRLIGLPVIEEILREKGGQA